MLRSSDKWRVFHRCQFSVECVSICKLKLWRGEGSNGRYDCSVFSCAWKAPRALTGSLASTTQSSSSYSCRRFSRYKYRCGASDLESITG
ncbi:putative GTP diphosphokinase RSH1 chloroplastic [Bienertia sinuspersici]